MTGPVLLQAWTKLASDASVFLIVGGLCILGVVVVLVVLRTAFPTGKPRTGGITTGPLPRRLANTPTLRSSGGAPVTIGTDQVRALEGHAAAQNLKIQGLDDILDGIINGGWGNARVLRLRDDKAVVRYYQCSECSAPTGQPGQAAAHSCSFQAGYLRGAFAKLVGGDVQSREVNCRTAGHPACEFEVLFP